MDASASLGFVGSIPSAEEGVADDRSAPGVAAGEVTPAAEYGEWSVNEGLPGHVIRRVLRLLG
jgi:hypothetical protein